MNCGVLLRFSERDDRDVEVKREMFCLYAVTDRTWLRGKTLSEQVEEALLGGVTMVQLREKMLSEEAFLAEAEELKRLCDRYHVPLIINDHAEIAKKTDAAGVHVGQTDMAIPKVRESLGKDKIIGASARTVEQALEAQAEGADYLGVGAVFGTSTKLDAETIDRKTLKEICDAVSIPVVAIGGISLDNVFMLKGTGIAGAAVVSAIFSKEDVRMAAMELKKKMEVFL